LISLMPLFEKSRCVRVAFRCHFFKLYKERLPCQTVKSPVHKAHYVAPEGPHHRGRKKIAKICARFGLEFFFLK